jgi:hypothetical protein
MLYLFLYIFKAYHVTDSIKYMLCLFLDIFTAYHVTDDTQDISSTDTTTDI